MKLHNTDILVYFPSYGNKVSFTITTVSVFLLLTLQ